MDDRTVFTSSVPPPQLPMGPLFCVRLAAASKIQVIVVELRLGE